MENKDWTDILYILIAVAFGIIGKIAQRKNKTVPEKTVVSQPDEFLEEEESPQPRKSKAESIFDTLYEAVLDEDISAPKSEEVTEGIEEQWNASVEVIEEPVVEDNGIDALLKRRHDEELKEQEEREKDAFDLRQAVIYSEILNRKYT